MILSTTRHRRARHPTRTGCGYCTSACCAAFPDLHPEIHWQVAAGNLVTTYKTYHGTHQSEFLGIPATGKKVSFYTVDAMPVVDGKITEHWGVATLLDLMQPLGVVPPLGVSDDDTAQPAGKWGTLRRASSPSPSSKRVEV